MPIFEKNSLNDVLEFLTPTTLLVLDLDNTLVESSSHFGSYQWGKKMIQKAIQDGMSVEDALDYIMPQWDEAQKQVQLALIEEHAPKCFETFHSQVAKIIGLTGRSPQVAPLTLEGLEQINLTFSSIEHTMQFKLPHPIHFEKGVLFVGAKNNKGDALIQFIKQTKERFHRVVFLDDQINYIEQVEQALIPLSIEYIGIRFAKVDEKVNQSLL